MKTPRHFFSGRFINTSKYNTPKMEEIKDQASQRQPQREQFTGEDYRRALISEDSRRDAEGYVSTESSDPILSNRDIVDEYMRRRSEDSSNNTERVVRSRRTPIRFQNPPTPPTDPMESWVASIRRRLDELNREQTDTSYFKPKKQDIRVGFEYEINEGGEWKKEIVNSAHDIMSPIIMTNSNLIRVPYITDEILTSLGLINGEFTAKDSQRYRVTILPRHDISIIQISSGEQVYKGGCKCINSLRIILRLLKLI